MASAAMTDPKKPGVGFWAAVVVVAVLVRYPLSFWSAVWLVKRKHIPIHSTATIYKPVIDLVLDGPDWLQTGVTLGDAETWRASVNPGVQSTLLAVKAAPSGHIRRYRES